MATTKTATQAKETTAPTRKGAGRPPAVDFDFNSVEVTDAPAPERARTFEPPAKIVTALRDSWDERRLVNERGGVQRYLGSGKSVVVPADAATTVENVIRRTAQFLGLGLSVQRETQPGNRVLLRFAAKTPNQRKPKSAESEKRES